jgi:transketolase
MRSNKNSRVTGESFSEIQTRSKLRLLKMHYVAHVGHIGGNLSALDAMLWLHHNVIEDDDVFILAKGHSAGALYISLWSIGEMEDASLSDFHTDNTLLAGHPVPNWHPRIPVATGSLGHGLPVAAGIALGYKLSGKTGHVYCFTSDGEWQEGSNWESLIFANHHKLDNLTVVVDMNGLQGFGTTKEVASIENPTKQIQSFGLDCIEIDGHDPNALDDAFSSKGGLRAVILRTVKGKGISFMENQMKWHYLPMNEEQYHQAVNEVVGR